TRGPSTPSDRGSGGSWSSIAAPGTNPRTRAASASRSSGPAPSSTVPQPHQERVFGGEVVIVGTRSSGGSSRAKHGAREPPRRGVTVHSTRRARAPRRSSPRPARREGYHSRSLHHRALPA